MLTLVMTAAACVWSAITVIWAPSFTAAGLSRNQLRDTAIQVELYRQQRVYRLIPRNLWPRRWCFHCTLEQKEYNSSAI
eukprot:1184737-Rhodomonas_salina.2